MKTSKKIWFGLGGFLAVLVCLFLFLPGGKAFAQDIKTSDVCVPPAKSVGDRHQVNGWLSVKFVDRADMYVTYAANGNCVSPTGNDSNYFFGNTTFDQIFNNISGTNGVLNLIDYKADGDIKYNQGQTNNQDDTMVDQFASDLDNLMGGGDSIAGHDLFIDQTKLAQETQNIEITLGLETDKVGYGCDSHAQNENFVLIDDSTPHWVCDSNSDSIGHYKGLLLGADNVDLTNFNITFTASLDDKNNLILLPVYQNERSDRTFMWCGSQNKFINKKCQGDLWLHASQDDINNLGSDNGQYTITKLDGSGTPASVVVAGGNTQAAQNQGDVGGGSTDDNSACFSNSHTGLEWLICPVINGLSNMADKVTGLVEDQLDFSVNAFLPGSVHKAWAIIKDLSTSIIVILLLIMVISQAISAGPFDAYTIRKLLPKLVVAVIVMQISWQLCIFAIGWANDAGHGVGELITAPFGGPHAMTLGGLLHHLSGGWTGATSISLYAFLVAAPTLAVLFFPGIIMLAFSAAVAAIVALATVLARNMIIIGLVIFSPLALIAWTLNGTQNYWKMWKENFSKLLLLFPMMMGLIYVGRVFAYLAGGVGHPGPLDFVMVMVGFFGPYFFLPKAWKWGGNFMNQAANAIATNGAMKKGKEFGMKQLNEWDQVRAGKMSDAYDPRDKAFKRGSWHGVPILQGRAFNRMASRHILPTDRSRNLTLQRGKKWSGEENELADAYLDKWVRTFQQNGISQEQADEWNGKFKEKFGYDPGFKKMDKGVGAGKQAARALGWQAIADGDDKVEKAVFRYLPRTSSILEYADPKFLFPDHKIDGEGNVFNGKDDMPLEWKLVPGFAHHQAVDQAFKEPALWQELARLTPEYAAHNSRAGGQKYKGIYGQAGWSHTPKDDHVESKLKENETDYDGPVDEEYRAAFTHEDGTIWDRPQLAHRLKAIKEDSLGAIHANGNTMLKFVDSAGDWAKYDMYGEGKSDLPAKELARFLVEESHTATGRGHIANLKSTPEIVKHVQETLDASGFTHFKDALGNEHKLTVDNLFAAGEDADRQLAGLATRDEAAPPRPHGKDMVYAKPGTPRAGFGKTGEGPQYQGEQLPLGEGESVSTVNGGTMRSWSPTSQTTEHNVEHEVDREVEHIEEVRNTYPEREYRPEGNAVAPITSTPSAQQSSPGSTTVVNNYGASNAGAQNQGVQAPAGRPFFQEGNASPTVQLSEETVARLARGEGRAIEEGLKHADLGQDVNLRVDVPGIGQAGDTVRMPGAPLNQRPEPSPAGPPTEDDFGGSGANIQHGG